MPTRLWLRAYLDLPNRFAFAIDDAEARFLQTDVQSNVVFHDSSPLCQRHPIVAPGSKFRHRPAIPQRRPLEARLEEPSKSVWNPPSCSPPLVFRYATRIHSTVHCNAKFSTGRASAIRLRANRSSKRRSTAVELLLRACCKRCAQPNNADNNRTCVVGAANRIVQWSQKVGCTSAFPPETDILIPGRHVSNAPRTDSCTAASSKSIRSFHRRVRARWMDYKVERLCGPKVDH